MNCSIYFFGELGQGYTQSPDDSTRELLETFFAKGQKGTRLTFVHKGRLAYYGYTRPLKAGGSYIGICCAFNDVFCNNYKVLFALFEDSVFRLVMTGKVLEFDENGEVVSHVGQFYQVSGEIDKTRDYIMSQLASMERAFEKLPPVNFATASAEARIHSFDDRVWLVIDDMEKYPRVELTKDSDFDSQELIGCSVKLNMLHGQIVQLEDELGKVKKQKKRTSTVVILLVVLLLAGVTLYQVMTESQLKQGKIETLNDTVIDLLARIETLKMDSFQTKDSLEIVSLNYQDLSHRYDELLGTIDTLRDISFFTGANHLHLNIDEFYYDNGFALWLHALTPVKIESFYVWATKAGNLTLGLYDTIGNVIDTISAEVKENGFVKVMPSNFNMDSKGYYYLAVHSDKEETFLRYHCNKDIPSYHGALHIVGSKMKNSDERIDTKCYKYFYDIEYKLR